MSSNEQPAWRRVLWERIAAGFRPQRVEREAVKLLPGDPRVRENYHGLVLGDLPRVGCLAREFFSLIRENCDFDSFDQWDRQREWLEAVFRDFFRGGSGEVGWASLATIRRPAQFRDLQDRRVQILQHRGAACPRPVREARYLGRAPLLLPLAAGEFTFPTKRLHFSYETEAVRRRGHVFAVYVPRSVHAPEFGVNAVHYREVWVCPGHPGEDEERLRNGHIPAVPEAYYRDGIARLRTVPILNLVKVNIVSQMFKVLPVEIDPRDGGVLSVRGNETSLAAGLLASGSAETLAVAEALQSGKT